MIEMVKRRKSQLEPSAGPRKRAYELGNIPIQVPQDPIRQIEDQALRDLSNEYRVLRVEEMISKKRKQLSDSGPTSNIQTQKDNLEIVKLILELQKMNQPKDQPDKTLDYLQFFSALITQLQGSSSQTSFFDQFVRARELGIVSQAESGEHNQFSVELEKIRNERMMSGKKIDLELHKMRLEQESARDKLNMVSQILAPVAAYSGARMAEDMRVRGVDAANSYLNPGDPANYMKSPEAEVLRSLQGKTAEMRVQCPCGYDKSLIIPDPPPSMISCPGCGKALTTGSPPISDAEAGEPWRIQT